MTNLTRPSTHEVMCVGRGLIADESNWIQDAWARTDSNGMAYPYEEVACKFCALGAMRRAELLLVKDLNPEFSTLTLGEVDDLLPPNFSLTRSLDVDEFFDRGISDYNDHHSRTHEEILQAFDNAIAKLAA